MGTWNTKPFGNDTASDWLWKLEKATDDSVLTTALAAKSEGEVTVAAAAVVEAARRQPLGKLPPEAARWVLARGFVPDDALLGRAIAALERVRDKSELRELWEESKSLKDWLEQIEFLLTGLREVQSHPPPARKPKASAAPRLLPRLIEMIGPDDEGPLRQKLRERLEAVEDVNALVKKTVMKNNLLCLVVAQGLVPEARRLIERGAKVNPDPKTHNDPLITACRHGCFEAAQLLMEHGAIINREVAVRVRRPEGGFEMQTVQEPTALYYAVQEGSIATVELLAAHGAKLSSSDATKCNLLHRAAEHGQAEMIGFLVKKGVNLEAKNNLGFTPLHTAANMSGSYDRAETVEKLLSLGANPNIKDNDGHTVLDIAGGWPCPDRAVVKLIERHGGMRG